ncbi:hypothetical protein V6N13_034966 [Hibiscus sabdariffa]
MPHYECPRDKKGNARRSSSDARAKESISSLSTKAKSDFRPGPFVFVPPAEDPKGDPSSHPGCPCLWVDYRGQSSKPEGIGFSTRSFQPEWESTERTQSEFDVGIPGVRGTCS